MEGGRFFVVAVVNGKVYGVNFVNVYSDFYRTENIVQVYREDSLVSIEEDKFK